jgi:hypothetical protein
MTDYIIGAVTSDNILAMLLHVIYFVFLLCKLKKEKNIGPLLFISQIPLLLFPIYRFSWSLSHYSLFSFIFLNYSVLLYFYCKANKNTYPEGVLLSESSIFHNTNKKEMTFFRTFLSTYPRYKLKTLELLGMLFIFSISFSVFSSIDFNNSFFSCFYVVCWFLSLYLSFNVLTYSNRLLFVSLYLFLLSSAVFMGFIVCSYLLKYGLPLSLKQIYVNKLWMTTDIHDQLKITGNIHNVTPLVFFINILSFSIILFLSKNKSYINYIDSAVNLRLPSIYKVLFLNLLLSFPFFLFFLTRGAIILLAICYMTLHFLLSWKKKERVLLIYFFFFIAAYAFSSEEINIYFYNSMNSLCEFFVNFISTDGKMSTLSDISIDGRLEAFKCGLQIIRKNFLLGIGINNYAIAEKLYTSPHNIIIQHIAETGILGFLFIICIVFSLIKMLARKQLDFLFCIAYATTSFFLYMTLFGGQFFVSGMCINGLTFFYAMFLIYSLKNTSISNPDKDVIPNQLNES